MCGALVLDNRAFQRASELQCTARCNRLPQQRRYFFLEAAGSCVGIIGV